MRKIVTAFFFNHDDGRYQLVPFRLHRSSGWKRGRDEERQERLRIPRIETLRAA